MGTLLYEKIKAICDSKEKVLFFIDMDGTIAEYTFFTKEFKERNRDGLFVNLRPLTSVIKCIEKTKEIPNIELYILSLCKYNSDIIQKVEWLGKHAPFIKRENIFILTRENLEYTPETIADVKAKFINEFLKEDEHAIFLEDTHKNMEKAKDLLGGQIDNFHISSFIE